VTETVEYFTKGESGVIREKKQVVIDREFDRIYNERGLLNPELIIEAARPATSPLHPYFEWDDTVAAMRFREVQAIHLLMASKMVATLREQNDAPPRVVERREVRRLLSPYRGGGFRMRAEVLRDTELRLAMARRKITELKSWISSTVDYPELQTLRGVITRALDELALPPEAEKVG
jgi:hypothetical protein